MRKPPGGARHQRRAQQAFNRHVKKDVLRQQRVHFMQLKESIKGMRCPRHAGQQCTIWWVVPGKGTMPLCDDCVPDRIDGDKLLRVLDPIKKSPAPA